MSSISIIRKRKKQSKVQQQLEHVLADLREWIAQNRKRTHSLIWSLIVHGTMLAVLAIVSLPTPLQPSEPFVIQAVAAGDDLGELDTTAIDFSISDIPQTTDISSSHDFSSEALAQLAVAPAMERSMVFEHLDSEQGTPPNTTVSGLASLGNDELRIAEADRRVGAAGGNLKAPIRVSLLFDGDDDIDLDLQYRILKTTRDRVDIDRLFEPHINFMFRTNLHGALDVDANAHHIVPRPCENIVITDPPLLAEYTVRASLFRVRGDRTATPIIVMIRYGDKTRVFKEVITPGERSKTIHSFRFARK